jgi:hypothetical protein
MYRPGLTAPIPAREETIRMRWLLPLMLLAGPVRADVPPAPPLAERLLPGERDGFVVDATRGCWLWAGGLSDLATDVEARWSGACAEGPAEGPGRAMLLWREGRAVRGMIYEGTMQSGRLNGQGALVHLRNGEATILEAGEYANDLLVRGRVEVLAQASTYEGALRDGVPHGPGVLRSAGGSVSGLWAQGCLSLPGGAWVAFLRAEEACSPAEE